MKTPDEEKRRKASRKRHLSAVYWLWFVLLLVFTLVFSLLVMNVLFRLHILIAPGPVLLLSVFTFTSVIVGAAFSQVFVRGFTRPILEMSDAAQRIAKGEFDIELTERTFAVEIEQMAHDFTVMARELAATEMMRSDFVSNVSHEIKTPLAAIEGYATLQLQDGLDPRKQQAYAGKVLENSRRLATLTDNILLLSQLEHDDVALQRTRFSLAEQLRECVLLYENDMVQTPRALHVELEELDYEGNPELLFDVWQNLLGNAMKFTENGDAIYVSLHSAHEGGVVVEVADTGAGMDEETCARAFEKFYQADRSHATQGSGLGLSLAKRIVDLHGGTICVRSAPGKGAAFRVWLP